jgi:hypothetical protein
MWTVMGCAIIGIFVVLLEMPKLHKLKQYKELFLFSVLVAASLAIYMMVDLHVPLPNPLVWITIVYEWFGLILK